VTDENAINVPPVLAAIGPKVTRVGEPLQFTATATDPNSTCRSLR